MSRQIKFKYCILEHQENFCLATFGKFDFFTSGKNLELLLDNQESSIKMILAKRYNLKVVHTDIEKIDLKQTNLFNSILNSKNITCFVEDSELEFA